MGYLLIKHITIHNIKIFENEYIYRLSYVYNNIRMMGLSFTLKDVIILKTYDNYHIYVRNTSLQSIQGIDDYLQGAIPNYVPILRSDERGTYLSFRICDKVNYLLRDHKSIHKVSLTIYKLNKFAVKRVPILYIL